METVRSVCICFSGLTFRFRFPNPIPLPEEFTDLLCGPCDSPDEEFTIELLTTPLRPDTDPIPGRAGITIYKTEEGWLRIYDSLIAKDGCQVACLLCSDRKNKLYYPASMWDFYSHPFRCLHLIAGEVLLLRHGAMLLHSSVVMQEGKCVLFSGPSGAGKSTQAQLWKDRLGSSIINGDRCLIRQLDGAFWGGGSPWCGTSGIRRKEMSPIAGIFLVCQAPENAVRRLGPDAFLPMLTQTTVNSWDRDFMNKVTGMIADLMIRVPVYRLECTVGTEAVELAYRTLFNKEIPYETHQKR